MRGVLNLVHLEILEQMGDKISLIRVNPISDKRDKNLSVWLGRLGG